MKEAEYHLSFLRIKKGLSLSGNIIIFQDKSLIQVQRPLQPAPCWPDLSHTVHNWFCQAHSPKYTWDTHCDLLVPQTHAGNCTQGKQAPEGRLAWYIFHTAKVDLHLFWASFPCFWPWKFLDLGSWDLTQNCVQLHSCDMKKPVVRSMGKRCDGNTGISEKGMCLGSCNLQQSTCSCPLMPTTDCCLDWSQLCCSDV